VKSERLWPGLETTVLQLSYLFLFFKKTQKLLSNDLVIGFGKFGNLANGGSNCAYMQKSVKLGIGVFAGRRDSFHVCILLPYAASGVLTQFPVAG